MAATTAPGYAEDVLLKQPGRLLALWRITRSKPIGAISGVICIGLVLVAIFAHALAPYPADALDSPRLAAPSLSHPFGTDNLFRDMFSRIIIGSRISLGIGFGSVAIGTVLGTAFGLISGYYGGWVDLLSQRLMDVVLGIPPLVLVIFFLTIFPPTFTSVSIGIGIIIMPTTARIVRGAALSVRQLQYIEAAESIGNDSLRIMARHVLPNVFAPIIVVASIQIGNAILAEAALSFLGLGIATDAQPSWGGMLQDMRPVWVEAWWTSVVPGVAISVAVLAFNLFGDALRDVLDPRLRGSS